MPRVLRHDRAHDYRFLIRRWRAVAAKAGLIVRKYGEAGGYDLYFARSRQVCDGVPAIYLSAGIHGDEVGATEGLIDWAEQNTQVLREMNSIIFPCLNPWGVVNNSRRDAEGHDLNRSFNNTAVPQIARQMELLAGRAFDLALLLHEDYDAQGVYIYELKRAKPYWGEELLRVARRVIGADLRKKIEGRVAKNGLVRRTVSPEMMPEWPEAFVLHFLNTARVFTIETPSEFHLDDRAAAHNSMIARAMQLCRKEFALRRAERSAS